MAWSSESMRGQIGIVTSRLRRRAGFVSAVIALAFVGAFTSAGALAAEIPPLNSRVTDQANILGPETRRRLTEALTAHENATGNQIAVLTIPTLAGEPVERYANRVFATWKLGRK